MSNSLPRVPVTYQPSRLDVVVGGQFGSEAKGRVTLEQIRRRIHEHPTRPVASVRVGGPNAGHVVFDHTLTRWAMRALPVGFVLPHVDLFIASGSEIDPQVLADEIQAAEKAGYSIRDRLYIHPEATVIDPFHIQQEQKSNLTQRLGSTAKGIGAGRADRIWRLAARVRDRASLFEQLGTIADWELPLVDQMREGRARAVVIEATQGFGLGMRAGHYPQCTSGDCRAIDVLAQVGIGPWHLPEKDSMRVHVVIRPFPIRVAGNSGPLYQETNWEELGLDAERTTVTNKIRRVGQFEPNLVRRAVEANGPRVTRLHLSMADQVSAELAGRTSWSGAYPAALAELITQIPYAQNLASLGTGPDTSIELPPAFL